MPHVGTSRNPVEAEWRSMPTRPCNDAVAAARVKVPSCRVKSKEEDRETNRGRDDVGSSFTKTFAGREKS
jgi:hypothetical protein